MLLKNKRTGKEYDLSEEDANAILNHTFTGNKFSVVDKKTEVPAVKTVEEKKDTFVPHELLNKKTLHG